MIYISTYKQIQNMFEITNPSYPLLNKNIDILATPWNGATF